MSNQFLTDIKNAVSQAVHHCNNHLSIILSNCELSLAIDDPRITRKKIESCISRVTELAELLAQLNRFATVSNEVKPAGLKQLFETPLKQIEARANALQVQCNTHIVADGLVSVPAHVIQLLLELLGTNAIHSAVTGSEKKVTFEVLQMDGEVKILAANSGNDPGSTSDKAIFNSFFANRSEPVYDSLASVKSLTEVLGGQIFYKKNSGMNEIHVKLPLKYEKDY